MPRVLAELAPARRVAERRLVYRTDSVLVRGRAEIDYRYGPLRTAARTLPHASAHDEARKRHEAWLDREVLVLSSTIQVRMVPDYRLESYLDPATLTPFRAVRWKNDAPDVLFDLFEPGRILSTRIDAGSAGLRQRLGAVFGRRAAPTASRVTAYPPLDVGRAVVDLLGAFFQLEQRVTNGTVPETPFHVIGIRKNLRTIYVARFEPVAREPISLTLEQRRFSRPALKCEVTLMYGVPVTPSSADTAATLAAACLPDLPAAEGTRIIEEVLAEYPPAERVGQPLVLPASLSVYNRTFGEDKAFEGPFGLSETLTLWIDEELGIPLRAECRIYGIGGAVLLAETDAGFLERLLHTEDARAPAEPTSTP